MGLFDLFKKKAKSTDSVSAAKEVDIRSKNSNVQSSNSTFSSNGTISLDNLIRQASPSNGGLYPHEIVMLDYAHSYKTNDNQFQHFWLYQYYVDDPQSVLDSLLERGFIELCDLRSTLEHLKVPEIKDELNLINEKTTGKKSELIDRLLDTADHKMLNSKYPERFFKLTSKGEQELKENQYVSYLHRHRYMSVWEMNKRIAKTHYPYKDVLWGFFNEQSGIHFQNYDFGLYRNTRYSMYQFLIEENKLNDAFDLLAEAVYYDLSLLENSMEFFFKGKKDQHFWQLYEMKLRNIAPYKTSFSSSPLATSFSHLQDQLNLSDNELKVKLYSVFSTFSLPELFKVFSDKECADIVIASIKQDTSFLEKIYKNASVRKYNEYKKLSIK